MPPDLESPPEGDALEVALRDACPIVEDLASRLARSRVAAALFGAVTPVRVGRYELEKLAGEGGGGVVFAAWDPELSRRVAVKLIDARGRRERVLAEAHALARLAHPNVVAIFDVGTLEDQIYLVMELVEGATLRGWVAAEPRSVRAIVRAYREAGDGLAAAHRAGFVHRDFKPDNALVGTDERVRVVDFGLAHAEGAAGAPGVGTPRYMALEQAEGTAVTPAVDQYAFCAALREALIGRRDRHGQRAETIPRWIDAITTRGLAPRAEDRYPSLDALLHALARDPASRWRVRGAVAGVVVVGAAAFAIGRAQTAESEACVDTGAAIAAVWNPSVRGALDARLDALGTSYTHTTRSRVLATLDTYAETWAAGQHAACIAHARGTQSDALFDRRSGCLDRAHAAFTSAVRVLQDTSAEHLAEAVTSVGELPRLARCGDPTILSDRVDPPPAAQATAVAQLDRELAAREVEVRAGRADEPAVRAAATSLVARARGLGYAPLLARALRLEGVTALAVDERAAAVAPLEEGTMLALRGGDDELAVELFARWAWSEGARDAPTRALAGLPLVDALAGRLPDAARPTRALLANNVGSLALAAGRRDDARAAFERAVGELADHAVTIELSQVPANLALTVDDPVRRAALFTEAIARQTEMVGPDHPITLDTRIMAATYTTERDTAERMLADACTTYAELHAQHGREIGACAFDLGWFALEREDHVTAGRWFETVVAAAPRGASRRLTELARAHLLRLAGDPRGALAAFDAIRAKLPSGTSTPWWQQSNLAETELGHGLAAKDLGDRVDAVAAFARAAGTLEAIVAIQPSASDQRQLERARRYVAAP